MDINLLNLKPSGYLYLQEKFKLKSIVHWHKSFVSDSNSYRSKVHSKYIEDIYPKSYWPGNKVGNHLEFALKYDGINLAFFSLIFNIIDENELLNYIKAKPIGKYTRRIWFLFEFLTGKVLQISDLSSGNYVDLLEPEQYYTIAKGVRIKRQRVVNNLLGNEKFCPIVRRTKKLNKLEQMDIHKLCNDIVKSYPPKLFQRALNYLYTKETKSSFEIEHLNPSSSRKNKFISLLEIAQTNDFFNKSSLINLQNRIVDPRFKDSDYREDQNYVGQTVSYNKEIIHYIAPAPNILHELMEGLLLSHQRMNSSDISAIIHATIISYGFVFMHPFHDGNGRIHRFLIHNVLANKNITPKGLMFPVSAAMLKNPELYNNSLENFSKSILKLIDYSLDEHGKMTVNNDISTWYKYMDMTMQAESLFEFIKLTIDVEIEEELNFLANYDKTKKAIQNIIDMPDRLIDLFIRFSLQNKGKLSLKKRDKYFSFITDEELLQIENALKGTFT